MAIKSFALICAVTGAGAVELIVIAGCRRSTSIRPTRTAAQTTSEARKNISGLRRDRTRMWITSTDGAGRAGVAPARPTTYIHVCRDHDIRSALTVGDCRRGESDP